MDDNDGGNEEVVDYDGDSGDPRGRGTGDAQGYSKIPLSPESYPDLPDPMMSQLYIKSYSACIYSYVKCYYMGYSFEIDGTMVVDQSQFELLMMAVFFDLKNNSTVDGWDKASRRKFDTPFWDFSGNHPGQACFDDVCYENYEVNYFAQGMWTAASGQSKDEGHVIVWLWNFSEYYFDEWKMPHLEGKYYWHDFGYDAYNTLNQIYDNLLLQYGE